MIIDQTDIQEYESRYRAVFINSLAGLKQAFLIGTQSKEGNPNLAIFNSLIHIGANPPLWGFICRPDSEKRDTLKNILETGQYTINYFNTRDYTKAHQTSAKYEAAISEFEACGFTEYRLPNCLVPFVAEAPIKIAMKFEQKIDISLNKTMLIIGSIQQIEIEESAIAEDGFVALDQLNITACAGLDAYYDTSLMGRLSYATPDQWPTQK
jgi:flavin reductase (DIM6/NTAB) family NADH-FMN oxidoreductase RutF